MRYSPIDGPGCCPYRGPTMTTALQPSATGGKNCTERPRAERGRNTVSLGIRSLGSVCAGDEWDSPVSGFTGASGAVTGEDSGEHGSGTRTTRSWESLIVR